MTQNRHRSYTIHNWKKRGLVCDDYKKLYEKVMNTERCEICNVKFDDTSQNKRCMDHDHKTEKFRGWICHTCNRALGQLQDRVDVLENAIKYLSQPSID